jgi:hypothetical protein
MLRCCGLDRPLELQLGSRSASGRRRKKGLIDFCSSAARTKTEGRKNALTDSGWHAVVVGAELEIHQPRRHHMPCPSNLLSFSLSPFRSKAKPWPLFSGRTLAQHRLQDPLGAFSGTRCLSATSVVGGAPAHFQQQSFLWMKVILKQRLSQAEWHDRTDRQSLTGAEWDPLNLLQSYSTVNLISSQPSN